MFYVINAVKLKKGVRQEFIELLKSNALGASNEPGCISFDVVQDNADSEVIWFIETYKTEQDFEAHQETSHFKEWHPHFQRLTEGLVPNTAALGYPIYPPENGWS